MYSMAHEDRFTMVDFQDDPDVSYNSYNNDSHGNWYNGENVRPRDTYYFADDVDNHDNY